MRNCFYQILMRKYNCNFKLVTQIINLLWSFKKVDRNDFVIGFTPLSIQKNTQKSHKWTSHFKVTSSFGRKIKPLDQRLPSLIQLNPQLCEARKTNNIFSRQLVATAFTLPSDLCLPFRLIFQYHVSLISSVFPLFYDWWLVFVRRHSSFSSSSSSSSFPSLSPLALDHSR